MSEAAAKIMVVEDERIVALHLSQQLRKLGYEVLPIVSSGEKAIRQVKELSPDLLLMDIHIEGDMDGIEAARRIVDEFGIPVIYLTAHSEDATVQRAKTTRPYGYLIKPFAERELSITLQMVLERCRAEAALRDSEHKYRTTFEMAPVGIVHMAPDGRYIMVNDFFCSLLDYQRAELLKMKSADVTDPEDIEATATALRRAREGDVPYDRIEKRFIRKDGGRVWSQATFTSCRDERGGAGYDIGVINDITARHEAETQQLRLAAQLQQAQKMEAIGQLTGGLAHDFNNLLGVVLGNLDFLDERLAEGSEEHGFAVEAIRAAMRGAELTRALLAFARRQPLQSKLTDLDELLTGAGNLFRRALGESIVLDLRPVEGLWPVMVDAAQFESAILNLAVNARDAMPGGGTLTIEARNVELDPSAVEAIPDVAPGDYVVVSVSDTGSGMPPDVVARAFDPFFTTKGSKGSGLGLSMVHGFVKQSGGNTKIYSEVGKGTTVSIYLPRAQGAAVAADRARRPVPIGQESILVVEDNTALCQVVTRRLAELGYRATSAANAAAALDILRQDESIALLFTDIVMPGGMDGKELAAAARVLRPGLRVLFTSGFAPAAASAALADLSGAAVLTKPYRRDELAAAVRKAIDDQAGIGPTS